MRHVALLLLAAAALPAPAMASPEGRAQARAAWKQLTEGKALLRVRLAAFDSSAVQLSRTPAGKIVQRMSLATFQSFKPEVDQGARGLRSTTVQKQLRRIGDMDFVRVEGDTLVGTTIEGRRRTLKANGDGEVRAVSTDERGVTVERVSFEGNPYEAGRRKADPAHRATMVSTSGIVIGEKRNPGSVDALVRRPSGLALPAGRLPQAGDRVHHTLTVDGTRTTAVMTGQRNAYGLYDTVLRATTPAR